MAIKESLALDRCRSFDAGCDQACRSHGTLAAKPHQPAGGAAPSLRSNDPIVEPDVIAILLSLETTTSCPECELSPQNEMHPRLRVMHTSCPQWFRRQRFPDCRRLCLTSGRHKFGSPSQLQSQPRFGLGVSPAGNKSRSHHGMYLH